MGSHQFWRLFAFWRNRDGTGGTCYRSTITRVATKLVSHATGSMPGAVHGLVLIGFFVLTVSLPSSGIKVYAGHLGRSGG